MINQPSNRLLMNCKKITYKSNTSIITLTDLIKYCITEQYLVNKNTLLCELSGHRLKCWVNTVFDIF